MNFLNFDEFTMEESWVPDNYPAPNVGIFGIL